MERSVVWILSIFIVVHLSIGGCKGELAAGEDAGGDGEVDANGDAVADIDTDTDSETDADSDGGPSVCTDQDGDGYIAESSISGCEPVCGPDHNQICLGGSDCDDNESLAFPGGTETCDTIDNDCDANTDEGCDDDSDNYCDENMPMYRDNFMCVNTPFITEGQTGDDCNDENSSINPGVDEVCGNSVDEDCDGSITNGCGSGNVYYISESNGSNPPAGSGTFTSPWRELDEIEDQSFIAGDKILLLCGDTWNRTEGDWGSGETEIVIGDISGITVGAYYNDSGTPREVNGSTYTCPGNNPVIDGNVLSHSGGTSSPYFPVFRILANTDNITIEDLTVQNYYSGFEARPRDNNPGPITNGTFQRLETYNTGRSGIRLNSNPRSADNVSNWTVANCRIIRSQMAFEGVGGWGIALSLKHVDNYKVYNNEVGQAHGEGIAGWGGADNGEIYNNLVYETGSVSIYLSCCHNVNVHHNYVVGTTDSYWKQRLGRTLGGIGFGGETDEAGYVDSSGCIFHNNVVIGRGGGFSVTDPHDDSDSTADGGYGTNYVYNNLFIDNSKNLWLWSNDGGELTITFQNNLSVVNDTTNSDHVANIVVPEKVSFQPSAGQDLA